MEIERASARRTRTRTRPIRTAAVREGRKAQDSDSGPERIYQSLSEESVGAEVVSAAMTAARLAERQGIPFEEALDRVLGPEAE